jgi:pimeloyl-ACP methyl ester carboxylesterase
MDADHIATELHGLLTAAKIDGPIVLAGHSLAGMYVRDYATRYPEQVKGIVFIDAFTPHQEQDPAFAMMGPQGQGIPIGIRLLGYGADTASALGLERLLGVCSMKMPGLDAAVARRIGEDRCRTSFSTMLREAESISRSGDETVHTGPYGDLPILIFSHGPNPDSSGDPHAAQTEAAWNRMQENLKLSTRSRRIIAKRSNHYIQFSRSELLEREIPAFIEQIRGNRPWPAQFGTTTVE